MESRHGDTTDETGGSLMRAARAASRRALIQSKQTRHTDQLPEITGPRSHGRPGRFPLADYLREENLHLHRELETLQAELETYQVGMDQLDEQIEILQRAHQQAIEQHQQQIREMMDEHNHIQKVSEQWEQRYQALEQTFQDAVEHEAHTMVDEAAKTLMLSPEHPPTLLSKVVVTLEERFKQNEDQRTAELLAIIHQAQEKAALLEQEIAREHAELGTERERLHQNQAQLNAQTRQRYQLARARLKARWTTGLTFVSMSLLSLMVVLELIFYSLHTALYLALFLPLGACLALSYVLARLHTAGRIHIQGKNQPARPPATPARQTQQIKAPTRP